MSKTPMSKTSILLIDDDRELAQGLALRIRAEFAVEVHCAHDPLHAIDELQRATPGLVICDVKMPTGNGLGICELMDDDARWKKVPTIVLTGCSDGHTLRRVANLSAYYVAKGGDLWPRLRRAIEEAVRLKPLPAPPPQRDKLERAAS